MSARQERHTWQLLRTRKSLYPLLTFVTLAKTQALSPWMYLSERVWLFRY
jgi:hypothetical protein